jgi:uncharacterized protein (TIGR02600 family)
MALVIVLASLVLLSILVVSILMSARQEVSSSNSYGAGSDVKLLADLPLSLVTAQIAKATSDPDQAWISQPGLLRTFSASGQQKAFKLYSSYTMEESGTYDPGSTATLSAEVPSDWSTKPNEFVDLNRPIFFPLKSGSRLVYPIADPNAYNSASPANSLVQGFSYDVSDISPASGNATANPLPMPVRWIYVTADGEFVGPDAPRRREAVARVAFWTDDETSKVNINTASDGVFYDSPTYFTAQDYWLGVTQPVAQEYQRFPGHPATTSLASVFKNLSDIPDDDLMSNYIAFGSGIASGPATRSVAATLLTPRISSAGLSSPGSTDGGSDGGRKMAWLTKKPVLPDSERLYASIDELSMGRISSTTSSGERSQIDLGRNPESLNFFLTTESRAPELNILNRPRITLWPFNSELLDDSSTTPKLTPEDRLIRFTSEIGSNRRKLYFQRKDAWDPAYDYVSIPENQDLYAYLQWMTRQSMPSANPARAGAGATLANKYTTRGRDQILTEMFDYLRSSVNTINYAYRPVNGPIYSFPQNQLPDTGGIYTVGFNDICPLVFTPVGGSGVTKGVAGAMVISEVMFQFYNAGEYFEGQTFTTANKQYGDVQTPPAPPLPDAKTFSMNGTQIDETNNPDGKPDYIIRRVQMVCLLDLMNLGNNLFSSNQRFQVRINGSPFGLALDPASKVDMRFAGEPAAAWRKSISTAGTDPEGIGFPVPAGSGYLDTTLVSGQAADLSAEGEKGGRRGFASAMIFPNVNHLAYPQNTSQAKTLTANATGARRYFDNGLIATTNEQRSQIYPFVSRMIEFRIPNISSNGTAASPFPAPNLTVTFLGSNMTMELFAGVTSANNYRDDFAPATLNFTLHNLLPSNLLATTTINVQSCVIPLPRLGNTTPAVDAAYKSPLNNAVFPWPTNTFLFPNTPTNTPSGKDMQYYPRRFWIWYKDYLAQIPRPTTAYGGLSDDRDVIRSYHLNGASDSYGDLRLAGFRTIIPGSWWTESPGYFDTTKYSATALALGDVTNNYNLRKDSARILPNKTFNRPIRITTPTLNGAYRKRAASGTPDTIGDFTTGYGVFPGGAGILGPDIGAIAWNLDTNNLYDPGDNPGPYYAGNISRAGTSDVDAATDLAHTNFFGITYSPWKQMPSAVMFGTLPSRALEDPPAPWETLLFCPNPAGGQSTHRGWTSLPRDHYWLDLFYMPVVEPYAITENFATNGKINMNCQIAPFTYITRQTGLYALLRNMQISAVPDSDTATYKSGDGAKYSQSSMTKKYRLPLNLAETLKGFEERFSANDPFVSASEICEMFLVPSGSSYGTNAATIKAFWTGKDLTGDDKKESPYNAIYPRVTTRSNTYRVHFWVQTLNPKLGRETPIVTGEYRGSTILERYLDPNIGVYGTGSSPENEFPPLSGNYRFRQIDHQQFAP